MSSLWYYTHDRQSHGPVTLDRLKELASRRLLLPQDEIWREGADRRTAVRASTTVPFPPPRPAGLPDWLSDVQSVEARRTPPKPNPTPPPKSPRPPAAKVSPLRWLDDVRRYESLAPRLKVVPPPSSLPLDWLEDIREIEQAFRAAPKPTASTAAPRRAAATLPAAKAPPTATPTSPGSTTPINPPAARPTAPALPARPAGRPVAPPAALATPPAASSLAVPPVVQRPTPSLPATPPIASPPSRPATVPSLSPRPATPATAAPPALTASTPATPPQPTVAARLVAAEPLPTVPSPEPTAPGPEVTGYDPETGQVLDAAKFAAWQREQRRQKESATQGMSVYEAFLTARKALQDWLDSADRKPLIETGDVNTAKQDPYVQGILREFSGYGPVMLEKLDKHIEFLVDNRRKFYLAFSV